MTMLPRERDLAARRSRKSLTKDAMQTAASLASHLHEVQFESDSVNRNGRGPLGTSNGRSIRRIASRPGDRIAFRQNHRPAETDRAQPFPFRGSAWPEAMH